MDQLVLSAEHDLGVEVNKKSSNKHQKNDPARQIFRYFALLSTFQTIRHIR